MTGSAPIPSRAQIVPVYHAADWRVVSGANEGDALSFADELALDDIYSLNSAARRHKLALRRSPGGLYSVEKPENPETKPSQIYLDCTMSLMPSSLASSQVTSVKESIGIPPFNSRGSGASLVHRTMPS